MLVVIIALDTSSAVDVPADWIIGVLVMILIAVLTAMGAIIKIAYDTAKKWEAILGGNGNEGFISNSEDKYDTLRDSNEQLYEQLLIQGRLLSELSYSFADIARELEEHEEVDINVNLERIERLRDEKEERKGP